MRAESAKERPQNFQVVWKSQLPLISVEHEATTTAVSGRATWGKPHVCSSLAYVLGLVCRVTYVARDLQRKRLIERQEGAWDGLAWVLFAFAIVPRAVCVAFESPETDVSTSKGLNNRLPRYWYIRRLPCRAVLIWTTHVDIFLVRSCALTRCPLPFTQAHYTWYTYLPRRS